MKVEKIVVGNLYENCYLIINDDKCLIVDPGDEFTKIKEKIKDKKVVGVLLTHAHFDHIGALEDVLNTYKCNLYYHNINNEISYEKLINIEEKEYVIDNFIFDVLYMKGHRNDLSVFYFKKEKIMFTGDFIFKDSIGRCDLEYSNYNDMLISLDRLKKINEDIILYPGHGEDTNLSYEKENNIYLN